MPEPSPSGWYPDPAGRHERRHWDGTKWTEHVASHGRQAIDPLGEATLVSTRATPQTAGGAWHLDPFGRFERRYWDGVQWTDHVTSNGRQGVDPPIELPFASAAADTARSQADWHLDPSGRYELRYWDGVEWTDHVSSNGLQGVDEPADRAEAPALGQGNKKIELQALKAGAAHVEAGGGTLFTEEVLVINQKAKVFGSTLGYAVYDQSGQRLGTIKETRRDLTTKMSETIRGRTESNRKYRFEVVDMKGQVLLAMTRPELGWFKSKGKLVVEGRGGAPIGQIVLESYGVGGGLATAAHLGITNASTIAAGLGGVAGMVAGVAFDGVQERLTSKVEGLDKVGHARFGLEAAGGQRLGSVHADSAMQWDFNVKDPAGTEVARITKTWAGWAKERFTKADNYVVNMYRPLEEPLRSLVVAAALAIDVEFKQQGDQTRGSSFWGTRRYN